MKNIEIPNKRQILRDIKAYKNIVSDAEFARMIGVTPQNLAKWYERNTFSLDKIVNAFPEINKAWLLTGEGEMLQGESAVLQSEAVNYIPLLPVSAKGGRLDDFIASIRTEECEKIISPIRGATFAMSVSGDSMAPEYPNGSKILVKKIDERAFIEWGRVYVLDTCNGSVIKRIMPGKTEESVTCESVDPAYPSFSVAFKDMYGMYRVMMLLTEK